TRAIPLSIWVFSTSTSMKTVPSAVINGVTSSLSTASMYCTETVLLIVVWIGTLVPCFTVAFSLFWVTTRGFDSSLPTPLDSAALMKKSIAKFGDRCEKPKPLVGGAPAAKLVTSGKPDETPLPAVTPPPTVTGAGGMPAPVVTPLPPTAGEPENKERPPVVVPAKPSSVPMSLANERDAATTGASISTCCDLRSS